MKRSWKTALGGGSIVTCIAVLLTALPAEPADPDAGVRRGAALRKAYLLEQQQKYGDAIETLRAGPRVQNDYLTEVRLGWLYYCAGNYANARREFALAGRINPASLEPWITLQLPLLAQQRYGDVEQAARQVMAIDPQHYASNLRQTYACRLQGRYGPAEKLNRRMLGLYPADLSFLLEQALTLAAQGEAEKARGVLIEVLRVLPSSAYARRTLTAAGVNLAPWEPYAKAAQLEYEGKYRDAAVALEKAAMDRPGDYFHNLRLGWLYYLAGDYELSRRRYEQAVERAPKAIEPLLGLLTPLLAAQNYSQAEAIARRILVVDPHNYTANLRRAYALRMQLRFSEAEEVCTRMLTLYPSDVSLLLEQALAVHAQGREAAARALYEQVCLVAPDNALALAALTPVGPALPATAPAVGEVPPR